MVRRSILNFHFKMQLRLDLKAGSAEFEVVKTADTKAWLWCEAQGLGIVADTR